jgi:hypothetical protein
MAALVAEIEHEAEVARKGSEPAGVTAVLSQDPHSHPRKPKKSSAPRFHAFRHEIRLAALRRLLALPRPLPGCRREIGSSATAKLTSPPDAFRPGCPFVRAG